MALRTGAEVGMNYAIDMGQSSVRANRYLAVDSRTGALTVTSRVDRETLCAQDLRAPSCEQLSFLAALAPPGAPIADRYLRVRYKYMRLRRNDDIIMCSCWKSCVTHSC